MIDRYHVRYFLAVVDQGNFSRAAARCHVAQPTLSVGIAKLERALGAELFRRNNQRVELTEAGARFLPHARRIEGAFNEASRAVSDASNPPGLKLGVLNSVANRLIAGAVQFARTREASGAIEIVYGGERELVSLLTKHRIDVALTLVDRGAARFLEHPLMKEGYALAMSREHRLADAVEIAAEELAAEAMIVRRHCEALSETSRHFTDRGVRPHFSMKSTNDERVLEMVAAGLGITVMPASHHHPGVVRPALTGFGLVRSVGLAFARGKETLLASPQPLLEGIVHALTVAETHT